MIARKLEDLATSGVPFRHLFELKSCQPTSFPLRRVSPKYDEVVRKEINDVLRANIIKPARSPWRFPVVTARKSDGRPKFCVDYRALNKRMKADKLPIPGAEEVIEDMAGGRVFSKLDMLAGH